ncbi:glycerol-3-phosphate 1-O-acyltransferase PlsY [Thermoactinomyces sp. DSM 45892]|uniref:glycerol-3-phosphate 1-O-acyltransferase PlsY n=1 Tax=Thermoactinomyces sp. DSM 45892 TaxID=1882753 RepID=UPI000899897C|nr:glycerol-3-phosphate 1-O-acyltransferase PlsY [Thermoactinomyces sp. DSM 45892]SDZ10429.1 acyl-phosphate glycerol-3-phosphate acyltransferase [Thermoactinomyces sp. DSM 45892]
MIHWVVPIVVAYLLGSISFSYVVGKITRGIDIREHGSGNAGATNTLRTLGKTAAIVVAALDLSKGIGSVLIAGWLSVNDPIVLMISGLAAVAGHNWPIYLGFRGGKGIATTVGVFLALMFQATLIAGVIAILVILITRYVSLGSLIFTVTLPIAIYFVGTYPSVYFWTSLLFTLFAFWSHRSNLSNLFKGVERKI